VRALGSRRDPAADGYPGVCSSGGLDCAGAPSD
jgi:hypothetical protein